MFQRSKKLDVVFERPTCQASKQVGLLGSPCKNESIVGDGNCLFRAISQAVSGSQNHHLKIRSALCKELQRNADKNNKILHSQYSSVSDYLVKSKINSGKTWATDVEIQVAANWLGVSVYTFVDDRWLKYPSSSKHFSHGIYLENVGRNHYENVVCVYEPDQNGCCGYCKVNDSPGYALRSRINNTVDLDATVVDPDAVHISSATISSPRLLQSKYMKQQKANKEKQNSSLTVKHQLEFSKHYSTNLSFRNKDTFRNIHKLRGSKLKVSRNIAPTPSTDRGSKLKVS